MRPHRSRVMHRGRGLPLMWCGPNVRLRTDDPFAAKHGVAMLVLTADPESASRDNDIRCLRGETIELPLAIDWWRVDPKDPPPNPE